MVDHNNMPAEDLIRSHLQSEEEFTDQTFFSFQIVYSRKGPVKLIKRGENSSFIFTVCVRSVPHYHFKLAYVILQIAVKNFSKPTSNNGDMCISEFVPKALKLLCFV